MEEIITTTGEIREDANPADEEAVNCETIDLNTIESSWPSEKIQSLADACLEKIKDYCGKSAAAYTNTASVPSFSEIGVLCMRLMERHNWLSEAAAIRRCFEADDPMLKAVEILEFEVVSVKIKDSKLGGTVLRSLE